LNTEPDVPPIYDTIWKKLSSGYNVLAQYTTAEDSTELLTLSKPLVEYLRPCGIVQESDVDIQFQNGCWLHIRRKIILGVALPGCVIIEVH
jgi:hypothetical protein